MSRKRRIFDVEMPEDVDAGPQSEEGVREDLPAERRGPMASAVRENAEALRARSEAEKAIRAENDALAHEYVRLRDQGLVLRRVPVEAVRTEKLTRDRRGMDAESLSELQESIRSIGLSNPVQVEQAGNGYELVQGLRRLTAYRNLFAETGDAIYSEIPAVVVSGGETIDLLYRRMVDENLIRSDVSFSEMAALARSYAEDPSTAASTLDEAVSLLYGSAGKQKRSYIRAFAKMLTVLDDCLEHPEAIPRALGLAVRKRMESDPDSARQLAKMLREQSHRSVEQELAMLQDYAGDGGAGEEGEAPSFPAGNREGRSSKTSRRARTTFEMKTPLGAVKCTASQGRLELRGEADFSAMERRRLEAALGQFFDAIGGDE